MQIMHMCTVRTLERSLNVRRALHIYYHTSPTHCGTVLDLLACDGLTHIMARLAMRLDAAPGAVAILEHRNLRHLPSAYCILGREEIADIILSKVLAFY